MQAILEFNEETGLCLDSGLLYDALAPELPAFLNDSRQSGTPWNRRAKKTYGTAYALAVVRYHDKRAQYDEPKGKLVTWFHYNIWDVRAFQSSSQAKVQATFDTPAWASLQELSGSDRVLATHALNTLCGPGL